MKILKIFFVVIFFFLLCIMFYFNLGKILDTTKKPAKTDLLVCLGGSYKIRIQKTLEIYKKGLDSSNIIILTGYANSKKEISKGILEDKRLAFLKKYAPTAQVILNKNLKNTADEVTYVKRYMLKHHLKSVTFITEPPHSRRILMLFSMISFSGDEHLRARVIGDNYKHWNKNKYYENKATKNYALSEVVKITYALLEYKILNPLGLLPWFKKTFHKDINTTKKHLHLYLNFIF